MSTKISYPVSPSRAFEITVPNYFGFVDVEQVFGVQYTDNQLDALASIPFSEKTLLECRDTHVLFPGFPLSLNEMRNLATGDFYPTYGYGKEPFSSEESLGVRWYLLRKEPVFGSFGKVPEEQIALLSREDELPRACEVAYAAILYKQLPYRAPLLEQIYVSCSDIVETAPRGVGRRITVGGCPRCGLEVLAYAEQFRWQTGLASMRRPDCALPTA